MGRLGFYRARFSILLYEAFGLCVRIAGDLHQVLGSQAFGGFGLGQITVFDQCLLNPSVAGLLGTGYAESDGLCTVEKPLDIIKGGLRWSKLMIVCIL